MSNNDIVINISSDESETQFNEKEKEIYVSSVEIKSEKSSSSPVDPHLHRQPTGRRRLARVESEDPSLEVGGDGGEEALRFLGRAYRKILNFHIVTRYFVYLFPIALILAIPLIIFATVAKDANAHGVLLFGLFAWLELVWTGLWVAKLCAKTLPKIFQVLCGMVSAATRKYTELIRSVEVHLSILVWVIMAWATVPCINEFNRLGPGNQHGVSADEDWVPMLRKVLLASIPVAGVWFVEKVAIHLVAVNYHRKQFQKKLSNAAHTVDLLTLLYTASRNQFEVYCEEFREEDYQIHNTITLVGKGQAKAVFEGLARVGNGLTSVVNNIASEVAGGRKLDPESDKGIVVAALQKRASAQALARRLWMSLAEHGSDALYEQDLVRVFGEDRRHDAELIFQELDKDANGDVSLDEMIMMLVAFEKNQKAMVRSMHDVKTSVAALDRILMAACVVLSAGIYAAFFSKAFLANLAVATTSIMSFSFAFAGTVQEFTGSCIFLFVKHPYDCDDRVDIGGVEMIVKHISLLYTVFQRVDTNRTVQIPNIVNNANWIENVTRSGAMKERFQVQIDASTPAEDIDAFHEELQEFVVQPENKRDFHKQVLVDVNTIGDFKSIELTIEYCHKSNWANEQLRLTRRTKFLAAVMDALRQVPIAAPGTASPSMGDRTLPSYSVTMSHDEAVAAAAALQEERQAARLVNRKKHLDNERLNAPDDRRESKTGRRRSSARGNEYEHL